MMNVEIPVIQEQRLWALARRRGMCIEDVVVDLLQAALEREVGLVDENGSSCSKPRPSPISLDEDNSVRDNAVSEERPVAASCLGTSLAEILAVCRSDRRPPDDSGARQLFERVRARRDAIGPVDFDVVRALREMRADDY